MVSLLSPTRSASVTHSAITDVLPMAPHLLAQFQVIQTCESIGAAQLTLRTCVLIGAPELAAIPEVGPPGRA